MSEEPHVALVTGATQGLGLALVKGLAQRLNADDVVYATGRDRGRLDEVATEPRAPVRRCGPSFSTWRTRAAPRSWRRS